MEDVTLEEFMKNPAKYREPEPPGKPPYSVGTDSHAKGPRPFNASAIFGANRYDTFAEAHEAAAKLFYGEYGESYWRQGWKQGGHYYDKSDLVILDNKGRVVFLVAVKGSDSPMELGEPQPGDGP